MNSASTNTKILESLCLQGLATIQSSAEQGYLMKISFFNSMEARYMYTIHMRSCLLADRKEDITVSIQLLLHWRIPLKCHCCYRISTCVECHCSVGPVSTRSPRFFLKSNLYLPYSIFSSIQLLLTHQTLSSIQLQLATRPSHLTVLTGVCMGHKWPP